MNVSPRHHTNVEQRETHLRQRKTTGNSVSLFCQFSTRFHTSWTPHTNAISDFVRYGTVGGSGRDGGGGGHSVCPVCSIDRLL